jgi:hypothetical protein
VLSTAPITAPSFDETTAIVAVVDKRSLAGATNHCEGSVVANRRWVWFDISPVFTDFSNSDVEYLAFLSKQGEKMVSSEPSNLRKK